MNPLKHIGANERRVVKNSVYSMLGSVLGQMVALLSSLVMARMLGVARLGSYTFAMTFAGLIFSFLNLGLGGIFHRNISQDVASAGKNYANALTMRFFFSMPLALLASIVFVFVMHRQNEIGMFILTCVYTGFTSIFSLISNGITAVEKFNVIFVFGIIQKILCFVATFVTLYFTKDILIMLIWHNMVFLILIIAELLYVNKTLCKIRLEFDPLFCKKMLRESFPTIFGVAAESLSLKSDMLILTLMLNESATGLYSVSSNVYIAASIVPQAIVNAATPAFNRMIAKKENANRLIMRTYQMLLLSSLVLIAGIFVFGRFGITLLWGDDFESAVTSLRILSIGLIFMPLNRFLEAMLIGLNKQVLAAKCSVLGAIFNILANILLVPIVGMNAAAVTTVITEFIVMAMEAYFYQRIQKYIIFKEE